jgi:hypothetical protein
MHLPDNDVQSFDSLINFIYRNNLPTFPSDKYPGTDEGVDSYIYSILIPLLSMAEKFCLDALANKVMYAIQDIQSKYRQIFDADVLRNIYEGTGESSKLRMYVTLCFLNYFVFESDNSVEEEEERKDLRELASAVPDFAADFVELLGKHVKVLRRSIPADPQRRDDEEGFGQCYFHIHRKGEKCHLDKAK